jgi:D-lyxose ketol-isomerase
MKARTDADWIATMELKGRERREILARAQVIIERWGLAMPGSRPIPLHFGLNDFCRVGEIEYWIVNDLANRYCGKFLFLFKNQRCPRHHHRIKDETFFIVRGTVEMEAGRRRFRMQPGATFKMTPGVNHTFRAIGGPALVLEVSLPSIPHDNVFADHRIGQHGII